MVAIGTAAGAVVASMRMRLDQATKVIPLGIAMGVLVIGLNVITNVWLAAPFLILLGAIGGFLVVPMNALLQHRGANLMGAGRSIAVQNFNEQACILGLGAFYTGMTRFGLSAFIAIAVFGMLVAGTMWLIRRWHQRNCVRPSRRDRAPAGDRAPRQALSARPSRAARAASPRSALVFNAFVWGTSWWPLPLAAGRGAASALGDGADLHARLAGDRRVRPRAVGQVLRTPALWVLVAAAGTHQRRVQLGRRHRRRRPGGAAVLPDAALDRAARAPAARRALHAAAALRIVLGAGRRGDRALAGAGAAPASTARRPLPLPRSLADWLGVVGGFSFALNNVMLRREAARPEEGRALAMFLGGALVAGALAAVARGDRRRCAAPAPAAAGWLLAGRRADAAVPRRQPGAAVRRGPAAGEPDRGRHAHRGGVRLGCRRSRSAAAR